MTRYYHAILAGVVASGIISTLITPTTASAQEHKSTKANTHASAVHAHPAAPHVKAAHVTAVHPQASTVREHANTVHVHQNVVRVHTSTEHSSVVAKRTAPAVRGSSAGRVTITREAAIRFENESSGRLHMVARSTTPIGRVTLQRAAVRRITVRHTALQNVTFLTGTIISRHGGAIVLRPASGNTVTVITQNVPVSTAVFMTGSTVVLPVRYVNGGFVLVPAYTVADEEELANQPMLAPCAINDNDSDDAGDTSYYAPAGACLNNDGDADDGYGYTLPALPTSFAPAPQFYSQAYAPVLASGFVVAQSGSDVVLMTPSFKPLVVNASAAMSLGATNGPLSVGRYVTVYGFDVNNTLVATSMI